VAVTGFRDFVQTVQADVERQAGSHDLSTIVTRLFKEPAFACTFWLRAVAWLRSERSVLGLLWPVAGLIKQHLERKYGVAIPSSARVGPGLYVVHVGGVAVSPSCSIGRNCTILPGVILGEVNRGVRTGSPSIGDDVYIGAGAKVLGSVIVGSNVAIGANAVVTKDVPDNAVVAGVPAVILSYDGSAGLARATEVRSGGPT
jgi:serine O-acetyltransferase